MQDQKIINNQVLYGAVRASIDYLKKENII